MSQDEGSDARDLEDAPSKSLTRLTINSCRFLKESDKLRATANKATQFHKFSTSASGGMLSKPRCELHARSNNQYML
jgi:hypothetical protein